MAALLSSTAFAATDRAGATPPPDAPHGVPSAASVAGAHSAIPAFSRLYETSCSTCHVTPGKLNVQGEAFRLNGYRFPEDDIRMDDPVPLGAEPWKELWPEAIWPGELPGVLPLALHLANDVRVARREDDGRVAATYAFPETVHLLAGTALGGGIAVYVDVGWRREHGVHLSEAKVMIQDVLPWLPEHAANLWIGAQRPHLLTFGDLSLDRAARQPFLWQRMSLADWEPLDPRTGNALVSDSRFVPMAARPALELNGLLGGRLHYGVGAAQPASGHGQAGVTDVYGKLRYKLGGLGWDGRAPEGFEPEPWGGQLLDPGVTLEHFAYFGETALESGGPDRHRSFGAALRAARGRGELGVGHVWGRNSRPWGSPGLEARRSSTFARAEYLFYPWLMGSAKVDRIEFRAVAAEDHSPGPAPLRQVRALPGLVVLVRPNVRAVAEGELFLRDRPGSGAEGGRPNALWLRLDVAF